MKSFFLGCVSLIGLAASPAAAQVNLPPQLTYDPNENYGPDPGPPSDATPEPDFTETHVTTGMIEDDGQSSPNYVYHAPGTDQSKARFTCSGNSVAAYVDQIRGPGQKPFGHLHDFMGIKGADATTVTYAQYRQLATERVAAGLIVSSCPGAALNGSNYWDPALIVENALGDGVTRVKKRNFTTLYYQFDNSLQAAIAKPFKPGYREIFGRNMDDPDMTQFKARVDAAKAANPVALSGIGFGTNDIARGFWGCETGGGAETLAKLDGTPAFECPATAFLTYTVTGHHCWNGKLSSLDGFSTTLPELFNGNNGKKLCPKEYRWRKPQIQVATRFSHRGSADYSKWKFSSDAHVATLLGRAVGNGFSGHVDYIYGWRKPHGEAWQCAIGIQFPGRTCTTHALNFNTIGPLVEGGNIMRLTQPSSVIDLSKQYFGKKLSDWTTLPPISRADQVKGDINLNVR